MAPVTIAAAVAELAAIRALASPPQVGQTDLIRLGSFDEAAILQNLKARFQADQLYTYIGSILLAVNPYKVRHAGVRDKSVLTEMGAVRCRRCHRTMSRRSLFMRRLRRCTSRRTCTAWPPTSTAT